MGPLKYTLWYARDGEPLQKYRCHTLQEAQENAEELRNMAAEHNVLIRVFITEGDPNDKDTAR